MQVDTALAPKQLPATQANGSGSRNKIGGSDYITPKRRQGLYLVYKRYILPIGWLYATYHLLQEPENPLIKWTGHFFNLLGASLNLRHTGCESGMEKGVMFLLHMCLARCMACMEIYMQIYWRYIKRNKTPENKECVHFKGTISKMSSSNHQLSGNIS